MRRRYKYPFVSLGVLLGLLLLVLAITQIVLWTDIPKKIVMGQIEKELGLHISADTLKTSLLGNSTLTGVKLTLPAAGQSFLTVDRLKIKHNTLIGLAIGQPVAVDSIEIDHPVVYVLQDQQGRWNLQQVAELLGRAAGGTTAQQSTQQPEKTSGIPKLPAITLTNGEVHVVDNQTPPRTADLMPLAVNGRPDGLLVYRYDAAVADSVKAVGFVQPGSNWVHQVDVTAGNLDPLLKGFLTSGNQKLSTYDARLDASWHGRLAGGKVTGEMAVKSLTAKGAPNVGDVLVDGGFGVTVDGPTVTVSPDRLRVAVGPTTRPAVIVDSGSIVSDATGVHARKVAVSVLGGKATASADFDPKTQDLDLRAEGSGLSVKNQITHGGVLTASVRQPFAGRPVIKLQLVGDGHSGGVGDAAVPNATWQAQVDLTGQGTSWNDIDWVMTAPTLRYQSGEKAFDLSRLSAHVTQRFPVVRLTDLTLPQTAVAGGSASVNVSGQYNDDTQDWNFDAAADFAGTYKGEPVPMKLALRADGNGVTKGVQIVNLKRMRVDVGDTFMTVDGKYDARRLPTTTPGVVPPTPVSLHVKLDQTPKIAAVTEGPVQGVVDGEFSIVGDLFKDVETGAKGGRTFSPYLTTTGLLRAHDLIVLGKPIGDIGVKLDGTTATPDPDQWAVTQLKSSEFYLLNAPWTLSLDFPVDDKAVLSLGVRNLSVEVLGKVAGVGGFDGKLTTAKWTVTAGGLSLDDIDLDSHYLLNDLKGSGVVVNSVDANLSVHKGVVRLEPLLAKSGTGTLKTTASFDLHQGRDVLSHTEVRNWPYRINDAVDVRSSADADLRVQIRKPNQFHDETRIFTTGGITASADVLQHNAVKTLTLAHTDLTADFRDHTINLTKLTGTALNGSFSGSATADIEKPLEAIGQFEFKGLDAAVLTVLNPNTLEGLRGIYSGTVTLAPATREPRPIGPVRMDLNIACDHGGYRSINIGGDHLMAVHAVGYLDKDRAVLDHSTIAVAGGTVHVWARLGRRFTSQLVTVDVRDFDLDQLAHVTPSIKGPMPGVINGRFGMVSSGPDISTLLATGHFDLTRTDLANFGPIAALYNTLNAGGGVQPTGSGSVDLAMEQGTIRITGFKFFNRGIDAGGIATIGPLDFANVESTFVSGQVGGAARPLKGSSVPGFQELDELSGAFQGTLTTFNIRGSLRDISAGKDGVITPAGLDDIGSSIKDIFGGHTAR